MVSVEPRGIVAHTSVDQEVGVGITALLITACASVHVVLDFTIVLSFMNFAGSRHMFSAGINRSHADNALVQQWKPTEAMR